jgi:PhnB protein
MQNILVNPYLFFKGTAQEAMEFYKEVFGGELTTNTYEKLMGGNAPEGLEGKLMHADLRGGDITLMGSDTLQASDKAAKVTISLSGDDEAKLTEIFNKLSSGGEVQSQLKKEAWGDMFGQLTDKYGIDWMVNINAKKE